MTKSSEFVAGLLADNSIRVKSQQAGAHDKVVCPRCNGGRAKEKSLSVTIDPEGDGATWTCHRGTCGWKGGGKAPTDERRRARHQPEPKQARQPTQHAQDVTRHRPAALYAFFEKRGISQETVDAFGLYVTTHFIPDHGQQPCIVFPYVFNGEVANRKYRPPDKKMPQAQEKDALPTLFNIDAVATPDVVIWVEGEPDTLAIHEAGYPQVVSLKDGAPASLKAENDPARETDKRFAAMTTHGELLDRVNKFILAGDMDEPGMVLREELARRLGRHRCWTVDWPAGCKDACDALAKLGAEAVRQLIEGAKPYPIAGLYELDGMSLLTLRDRPPPPLLDTGLTALDRVVKWPGEGRIIVVTGYPNMGKSSFLRWLMVKVMERHDRRFVVFSPEMQPWLEFAATCAEVVVGKPFRSHDPKAIPGMAPREIIDAEAWLRPRVQFLASDGEEDAVTLTWIIDRTRAAILRHGSTDLVIDPWNEVEHSAEALSQTDYIGRALQMLRGFGQRHGVNIWIVAHPNKPPPPKNQKDPIEPPELFSIAGSAHWANKADLGVVVHHDPGKPSLVVVRKCRFYRWGRRGNHVELDFDPLCGRYYETTADLYGEQDA